MKLINTYRYIVFFGFYSLILVSCNSNNTTNSEEIPELISYNFDIRPILSDNCFACHGRDANAREAGLRLDIEEEAFKSLSENPGKYAIVKGNPHESIVWQRIMSSDENEVMPPPKSNLTLTIHQKNLIQA